MKKFLFLAALMSVSTVSQALNCYKNTRDQSVKRVCFLNDKKGKTSGFLLEKANGTKSYLVVTNEKRAGYASQEYGNRQWIYTVKRANSSLEAQDKKTSRITVSQSWEYSDGGTFLSGATPGGIELFAVIEQGDSVSENN